MVSLSRYVITKLTKEDISNGSGGSIIEPVEGFFFVASDEYGGREPKVLAGPFPSYEIARDQARVLGVGVYVLPLMQYIYLVNRLTDNINKGYYANKMINIHSPYDG